MKMPMPNCFLKKLLTKEVILVCDSLDSNVAKDSETDTDNDFTDDDFIQKTD